MKRKMLQSRKDKRATAFGIFSQAVWPINKTRRHSVTVKMIKRLIENIR
jgi:hypothetical protein